MCPATLVVARHADAEYVDTVFSDEGGTLTAVGRAQASALAEELRGTGLQAMTVLPGSVDTDMLVGSGFTAQMGSGDVARTVAFAALDAPDAMNGSSIEMFGP